MWKRYIAGAVWVVGMFLLVSGSMMLALGGLTYLGVGDEPVRHTFTVDQNPDEMRTISAHNQQVILQNFPAIDEPNQRTTIDPAALENWSESNPYHGYRFVDDGQLYCVDADYEGLQFESTDCRGTYLYDSLSNIEQEAVRRAVANSSSQFTLTDAPDNNKVTLTGSLDHLHGPTDYRGLGSGQYYVFYEGSFYEVSVEQISGDSWSGLLWFLALVYGSVAVAVGGGLLGLRRVPSS